MDEHREHKRRDYVQYNFLFMTEFITERLLHFRLSTAVIILLYNGECRVVCTERWTLYMYAVLLSLRVPIEIEYFLVVITLEWHPHTKKITLQRHLMFPTLNFYWSRIVFTLVIIQFNVRIIFILVNTILKSCMKLSWYRCIYANS